MNNIGIASDHAGYILKRELIQYLKELDYQVTDFGTDSEESSDYPDFAHLLAEAIENKTCDIGVAICGTGNGINITVNKHQGIRAALCWNKEIASLSRQHNDANICTLPARFISLDEAKEIVNTFLSTDFEGGRHLRRINKIPVR